MDTASNEYGVPDLCSLSYTLEPSPTTDYAGISILTSPLGINVLTTNSTYFDTDLIVSLSAHENSICLIQIYPSQVLTFTLSIKHPCLGTVITLPFSSLAAMSAPVGLTPSTQTFAFASDSKSVLFATASYCGPFAYSIKEGYPFASVNSATGVISV